MDSYFESKKRRLRKSLHLLGAFTPYIGETMMTMWEERKERQKYLKRGERYPLFYKVIAPVIAGFLGTVRVITLYGGTLLINETIKSGDPRHLIFLPAVAIFYVGITVGGK